MSLECISGVDRAKLQEIISRIEFVENEDKISRFKCVCCNIVALYQYLATCKHVYCGECHGKMHGKPCLVEGCAKIVFEVKQNSYLQTEMSQLMAFCKFRKNGCQEEIPLAMYLQHAKNCQLATKNLLPVVYKEDPLVLYKEKTNGSNSLKNTEAELKTLRNVLKELQDDQEKILKKCDRIKEDILVDITERLMKNLEENLQQKFISSINKEIKRNCDRIKADILEDITERVTLKVARAKEEMDGKCLKIIQNDREDMLKLLENKLEDKMIQQVSRNPTSAPKEQRNDEPQIKRQSLKIEEKSTIFEWVLPGIKRIVQRLTQDKLPKGYKSVIFAIKDTELNMRAILAYDACIDWITISSEFISKARNTSSDYIYYYRIKCILLDKSAKEAKKDAWTWSEPSFGTEMARRWMTEPSTPIVITSAKALENGCITNDACAMKIVIEPISVVGKSYYSNNGVLFWKIENYKQRKQDAVERISKDVWSASFYSSEKGYRMRVVLHLAQTFFDAEVCILVGEFDDNLPPVFPHVTRIFILDQTDRTQLERNEQTFRVDEPTVFRFDYSEIEKLNFPNNDCLLIKVVVEPINE